MSIVYKSWDEKVIVPEIIERRYCPTDNGHWIVTGDRCPVCKHKIKTAVYQLVDNG